MKTVTLPGPSLAPSSHGITVPLTSGLSVSHEVGQRAGLPDESESVQVRVTAWCQPVQSEGEGVQVAVGIA